MRCTLKKCPNLRILMTSHGVGEVVVKDDGHSLGGKSETWAMDVFIDDYEEKDLRYIYDGESGEEKVYNQPDNFTPKETHLVQKIYKGGEL